MGGTESQLIKREEFNRKDWEQVPLLSYTNNSDPYYSSKFKVLSHKYKKYLQSQLYHLFFNSQAQYHSYLQLYNVRKHSSFLVTPFHIQQTTEKNMCATFHSASLYLERIPLRLFEITDVPLTQGAYMLQSALQGYETILQKTGYFQISSDMICINQQGKVKVWLNRNLSKNFPDFNKIDHNKSQTHFVTKIIEVIEQSIDFDSYPNFTQFLLTKFKEPSFRIAKLGLKEYCKTYNITPAKVMRSVLIIYKGDFQYDEKISHKEQSIKTKTVTSHLNFGRKSFDKLPTQKREKPLFKGSTVSGSLHMSFIKNNHNHFQFDNGNHQTPSVQKKTPSVAFFYKNTGLYSPQNHESKQMKNIWKQEYMKASEKHAPKNVGKKKQNFMKKKQPTQSLYFSTQKAIELDPDIAKDLQALNI